METVTEVTEVFEHDGTDWSAQRALERYVHQQGWSISPTDVTGTRALICEPGWTIAATMSELTDEQRAQLLERGDRRFDAYYYSFEPTGCEPVDIVGVGRGFDTHPRRSTMTVTLGQVCKVKQPKGKEDK